MPDYVSGMLCWMLDIEECQETESLLTSDGAVINGVADRTLKSSSTNGDKTLSIRPGNCL